jgi:hypothetical protein
VAGISQEVAQNNLNAWIAASLAVAKNQSYTIGDRTFTKADAGKIREMIDYWEGKVAAAEDGRPRGIRLRGITVR